MSNIKLEVGKRYRRRDGEIVMVDDFYAQIVNCDHPYPYWAGGNSYTESGVYSQEHGEHPLDLIEEVPAPVAETPTAIWLDRVREEAGDNAREREDRDEDAKRERELHSDHLRMGRSVRLLNTAKALLFTLLGVASLVFATRASARELMSTPNNVGGEIVLTDVQTKVCGEVMRVAIARHPSGMILSGCWLYTESAYVYIRWGDNDVRMYRLEQFRLIEQADEIEKRPAEYQAPRLGA